MLDAVSKGGDKPDESTLRLSNQPGPNAEQLQLSALVGRKISDMGFKWVLLPTNVADLSHGDLLFLSYKTQTADPSSHPTTEASSSTSHPAQPDPSHPHTHTERPLPNTIPLKDLSKVQEPEVDLYWKSKTGKIERKRDPTFCRHGDKGMCDYCMPLEVS
jgi:nuclear protein localization family protein 4